MNLQWTIKPFAALSRVELYTILRLRVDVFVVEQQCAYAEVDGADQGALHVQGLDTEGRLVAYARILPGTNGGPPHIGRVVVHPQRRGEGLGRAAMLTALNELQRSQGSKRSMVAAQCYLEAFYNALGYQRQGPDYDWDGIPHVDMLRPA